MRRIFFYILLAGLIIFGFYRWQHLQKIAEQSPNRPLQYTPATGPRIDPNDVQVLTALDAEYTRLVAVVTPSVVAINTSRVEAVPDPFRMFFGNRSGREKQSMGSGVIVSKEGHILTNHHVVAGMEKIAVQLSDGGRFAAKVIGSDEVSDIAVLKIDAPGVDLVPLPLGNSDSVHPGQLVFAVGNPFGLQETVTQGIVSAKGRRAVRDSGVEFLQTDAAVNAGNSGGPLINLRGEVVGINSAIYSTSPEGAWLGISFAIPSNVARRALESVLKNGRIVRGYLGVTMRVITPELARDLRLPDLQGTLVEEVLPGSPADRAGLKPRDVIRRFNGRPVPDIYALRSRVAETELGTKVELGIVREGREQNVTAEIVEMPPLQ
jgi:serine protease Do